MATKNLTTCDLCGADIELAEGATPTRIMVEPSHGAEIGSAHDTKDACEECKAKLYAAFPKLADAERLVRPVPVPEPAPDTRPELDTATPEQLLELIAKKLGVEVKRTS